MGLPVPVGKMDGCAPNIPRSAPARLGRRRGPGTVGVDRRLAAPSAP